MRLLQTFSKVFDKVFHAILIRQLSRYGLYSRTTIFTEDPFQDLLRRLETTKANPKIAQSLVPCSFGITSQKQVLLNLLFSGSGEVKLQILIPQIWESHCTLWKIHSWLQNRTQRAYQRLFLKLRGSSTEDITRFSPGPSALQHLINDLDGRVCAWNTYQIYK